MTATASCTDVTCRLETYEANATTTEPNCKEVV